jgi:phenylpropionate dioxygenase-like ring-hydroxylating dioxygenase large terminal subunit
MPDRCLHRATLLSQGRVCEGRIECPYHGWAYNTKGEVVEIPSEGPRESASCDSPVRPNLILKPLPCIEKQGAIWVWTGDSSPATTTPPWDFPLWEDSRWTKYFMITDFENEVTHLVENFMDVPHTVFVHRGWFRNRALKPVPMTLDISDGKVLATYHQPKDSIGFSGRVLNPQGHDMTHTDCFIFPNLTRVDYHFGPNRGFIINSQCTPVETLRSRVYTYIAYRVGMLSKPLYPFFRFYTRRVIEQDVQIMRNQGESFRRDFSHDFRSTSADELHVAIERLRHLGMQGDPSVWTYKKSRETKFWI